MERTQGRWVNHSAADWASISLRGLGGRHDQCVRDIVHWEQQGVEWNELRVGGYHDQLLAQLSRLC